MSGTSSSAAILDRHGLRKPRLRGRIHRVAFYAAMPAGLVLVVLAPDVRAKLACAIYALTLVALFAVSSTYHLGLHTEEQRARWRRADHATIFLLIAGTYTPFCLLVLSGTAATVELAIVWTGALAGVAIKMWRVDLHVLSGFMYIGLGWVAVVTLPAIARGLDAPGTVLLVIGGALFTFGALVLATHKPDPWPRTFGYHEIWHSMTVLAATCHYVAILRVVLALR
ncbi:MAG: hemolysin III family protein [Actinomycetota bacterium]|nr:hemolysin III family protein [Actinomycetota bacterium]